MPFSVIHLINSLDLADYLLYYDQVQNYLISHSLILFFYRPLFMINLVITVMQLKMTLIINLVFTPFYLVMISSRKLLNQPIHYLYIIISFVSRMLFMLPVFELVLVGYLHSLIFKYLLIAVAFMDHYCLRCLLSLMMLLLILELRFLFALFCLLAMVLICFEIVCRCKLLKFSRHQLFLFILGELEIQVH
jgi:hypothetical protein